jgi:regulator of sigma E protease
MDVIVMIAQVILSLSILVGLHEMGHLLAAKAFGMRVEQFSIGFPPKVFSFKYGETEYSLSAIPLGGYVKISGMIDESLDTKNLSAEPQPWEFRAKPAWQRLIVMMGGIIVNVITGIIVFVLMVYAYGDTYVPREYVDKHGIIVGDLGYEIGLRNGDKILSVNGNQFTAFEDVIDMKVFLADNSFYEVARGGERLIVNLPSNLVDKITDLESIRDFINFPYEFEVGQVAPGTPAAAAGLVAGDRIIQFNEQPIRYYHEVVDATRAHAGQEVTIIVDRNETLISLAITPTEEGTMGYFASPKFELATRNYTFAEAIPEGTVKAFSVVWINIKAFGKIFKGEVSASKSLSGPIGIARIFGGTWDWQRFWNITGLLSMVLAFMNFLPIPALDGGHVMFLLYEMVSGRKPSDKFLENAQKVGMVLLLTIMAYAIFNDIWKLF